MSTFAVAIITVIFHEKGYVNDPNDPGGETNFGISKRSYPHLDIKNLTQLQAEEIYKRDWWDNYEYGRINDQAIATKVFDNSVPMGAKSAANCLQRAIRSCKNIDIYDTGEIDAYVLSLTNSIEAAILLPSLKSEIAAHYRLINNPKYIQGWLNRAYS